MKYLAEKIDEICKALGGLKTSTLESMTGFTYKKTDYKKPDEMPFDDGSWEEFSPDTRFFDNDAHVWFHKKFKTCEAQEGKKLVFSVSTYPETGWQNSKNPQIILYLNGEIVSGMDINHRSVSLEFDTEYDMYVYFYIAPVWYGTVDFPDSYVEFKPSLSLVDIKIERLLYDLSVPLSGARLFLPESTEFKTTVKHLNAAACLLDLRKPFSEEFYNSLDKASDYLADNLYNQGLENKEAKVCAIGHTHIDVAWLWQYRQTVEKVQRSFATVVKLMEEYPEYKFMSSQAQLYKFVKIHAPKLFEKIKKLVKEGRWEVEGATWVEADCNLTGGESLIRQIMFGKRFFKEEFDVDSKILWLPDVFGYSAALPQILKKSGVDKFVTSKISWNQYNKMPYDTFMWQGIDGTEIFTYFLTTQRYSGGTTPANYTVYNALAEPSEILGTWDRYQQKEYNNEVMTTFGWGDGGGGPESDMLEKYRRSAKGIPGIPKTEMKFAGELLENVKKNFDENCKLTKRTPKWVGELYLEHHRGTYTSIAKNKKNNRKSEFLYQKAEGLSVLSYLVAGTKYQQGKINEGWETILINQFHDVIPGTSIKEVYQDTDKMYAEIKESAENIIDENVSAIIKNIETDGGLWVYNPNSFEYSGYISHEGRSIYAENIPSFGWKVIKDECDGNSIVATNNSLENKYYRIIFDDKAEIVSLYDKENKREVVKKGEKLNKLIVCNDTPHIEYDAWETASYLEDTTWDVSDVSSVEILNEGGRCGLSITKTFMDSVINQKIYLYENSRRIDVLNDIDWQNNNLILKALFPINVNAQKATYEVQFGNVERSTHQNTSWDAAKFEVCAHKWADISDGGYGLSLLNDCKYGHSADGSTLKMSLLKSPTWPYADADLGKHEFTYSLLPHKGDYRMGETVKESYKLNQPVLVKEIPMQKGFLPESYSMLWCDAENIIIETVKKAEDSDDFIIRMYESHNSQTYMHLETGFEFEKAYLCDMLENNICEIESDGKCIDLDVEGFEIVTVKFTGAKSGGAL